MSKKHKHAAHAALPVSALRDRVQRAVQEGRFQQALDLAKQLYKQEATGENQELLRQTYLGRARQLRGQGATKDAATTLQAALQIADGDARWVEQVAQELAACGAAKQALDLIRRVPDSPAYAGVLENAVDAAVRQGKDARAQLPETLHEDFDRVLRAFILAEQGQDDQARETLQPIGLKSPLLEWKVLLRGFLAYYQQDDERALENWQRLNPDRLPARLAAPFRFQLDGAYRAAQPPETQTALQRQLDRFQDVGLVQPLRRVQALLANPETLPEALRLVEGAAHALRAQAPPLLARLARCFYWAIIHDGEPGLLRQYQRLFGAPPDDPRLERLEALASEHRRDLENAHSYWQKYENTVAAAPEVWPDGQASRVRALLWGRMGENAASVPDLSKLPELPPFLRNHPNRPRPLKPSAEECFRRSIQLAPDHLGPREALFYHYREQGKPQQAAAAARELLDVFPDHVPMLDDFGDLCMKEQDYAEAVALYQRALQANPLDRKLRHKVSTAHLFHARTFAEAERFAEARVAYQAALAFDEQGGNGSVYCKWSACEFKAGDEARAEELLHQALSAEGSRLAVAYNMVIEAIRLKLKRSLKQRFDQDFNAALAEPPTAAAAAALAETTAAHVQANVTYHGQKTHQKKVLTYLDKAQKVAFSEAQLERVCSALRGLKGPRRLASFAQLGQRRFPKNPYFYFVEAQGYLDQGPHAAPTWKIGPLLEKARKLASALPPDDRQKDLLERIDYGLKMIAFANPFLRSFEGLLDEFLDYDDDEDDGWDDDEPSGGDRRGRRR